MIRGFQLLSLLGEGPISAVYKVKSVINGSEFLLKRIKVEGLSEKQKENVLNEIRILVSMRHPNIIHCKEAFIDGPSSSLWYSPFIS